MPNDGLWDSDGSRLQSWLRRNIEIRSRSTSEGFSRTEIGLIVKRYYKDEEGNRNGVYTEYDVFLPRYQLTLSNVPIKTLYQGVDGGQQVTLKVADGVPDGSNPNDLWRQVMESNGDIVTLTYVGGRWPVIDGCINHVRDSQSAEWVTDSTDGEVCALTYNTTRSRINNDGNIEIDLEDDGSHDRSVIINFSGNQVLKISQDSGTGDVRIDLGTGGEKAILGETFQTWFNNNVKNHTHLAGTNLVAPSGGGQVTGATGTPSVPLEMLATNLTDKVKVEG